LGTLAPPFSDFFLHGPQNLSQTSQAETLQTRRYLDQLIQRLPSADFEELKYEIGFITSDFEKLERRIFAQPLGDDLGETCSLCCEAYRAGDGVVSLPKCKHVFHRKCVAKWLLRKPLCPSCRNNVKRALNDLKPGPPQHNG